MVLPEPSCKPHAISLDEACRTLGGISEGSLRRLIAAGELTSIKLVRRRLVLTSSIDRLIERKTVAA